MSKIALSGDASGTGTFTIASPNSNSNFTLTLPTESGTVLTGSTTTGFKNRLINGEMDIDQRNNGASVTVTNDVAYVIDRFRSVALGTSLGFSTARSTTAPSGFTNSLLATVTTAKSPASTDQARVNQSIEGFNVADLAWGTASAQAVTISFWVRSSVTGTYCVALGNAASATRSYVATYTINAANTFEYKTITVPGDTSGTWTTSNSIGLVLSFTLGCGSGFNAPAASTWYGAEYLQTSSQTAWINNAGATFYITGVQLEKGSQATAFDFRDYGTELLRCQRYFFNNVGLAGQYDYFASGGTYSTSAGRFYKQFPVTMRVPPTFSTTGSGYSDGTAFTVLFTLTAPYITTFACRLDFTAAAVFSASAAVFLAKDQGTAFAIAFSSEL